MRPILFAIAGAVIAGSFHTSSAQSISVDIVPAFPQLFFAQPIDIQNAGDGSDRLFICEKLGALKVFQNDRSVKTATTFLDLSDRVVTTGEMGLVGVAFHPNYSENGYFYVNYNERVNDSNWTVISRFSVSGDDPNKADPGSEEIILRFDRSTADYNGGQLAFGPDGDLYIAAGDGGSEANGQELNTLSGKILRIDVDHPANGLHYGIPEDNPFVDNPDARDEIYAYGLHNPRGFSFDRETGLLIAGDVGDTRYEEIDIVERGKNYGWGTMEGWHCHEYGADCDSTGLTSPIWEYDHGDGGSVTGGYVYRGADAADLTGMYMYADFMSGRVWALQFMGPGKTDDTQLIDSDLLISAFGVDESDELYFAAFNGSLYKFEEISDVARDFNHSERDGTDGVALESVSPNPASGTASINYTVRTRGPIMIALYNIRGDEIIHLTEDVFEPGEYHTDIATETLPDAVYYVQLRSAHGTVSVPFTVIR